MIRKTLLGVTCAAAILASSGIPALAAKADMTAANAARNNSSSFEAVMEIPTASDDMEVVTDEADDEGMYDVAVLGSDEEIKEVSQSKTLTEEEKEEAADDDLYDTVTLKAETRNAPLEVMADVAPAEAPEAPAEVPEVTVPETVQEQAPEAPVEVEQTAEDTQAEAPEVQTEEEAPAVEEAPAEPEVAAPAEENTEAVQAPVAAPNANIDLPADVQAWCEQAAAEFGLDKNVLEGLVWVESKGNVGARNGSFIGLTQLNPKYFGAAMGVLGISDPAEALSNLRICAYSLNNWIGQYGNTHIALDCWHRGEPTAAASRKTEGTGYTRKIMEKATQYAGA